MVKTIVSPRYEIDATGTDLLSSGELGRGGLILKNKKIRYFQLTKERLDLIEI